MDDRRKYTVVYMTPEASINRVSVLAENVPRAIYLAERKLRLKFGDDYYDKFISIRGLAGIQPPHEYVCSDDYLIDNPETD